MTAEASARPSWLTFRLLAFSAPSKEAALFLDLPYDALRKRIQCGTLPGIARTVEGSIWRPSGRQQLLIETAAIREQLLPAQRERFDEWQPDGANLTIKDNSGSAVVEVSASAAQRFPRRNVARVLRQERRAGGRRRPAPPDWRVQVLRPRTRPRGQSVGPRVRVDEGRHAAPALTLS
jgi:hypothetical protein